MMDAEEYLNTYQSVIGNRVKKARQSYKITTTEAAKKLGINRSRWLNWECGLRAPKVEMIPSIAKLLDCSPSYIAGFTADMRETNNHWEYVIPQHLVRLQNTNSTKSIGIHVDELRKNNIKEKDLITVTICDNSLDPDFKEGDVVLIDKEDQEIKNGFFAIRDGFGMVWVRGIRREIDGTYTIYTLDEKHHPSISVTEVELNKYTILGRVRGRWNWI